MSGILQAILCNLSSKPFLKRPRGTNVTMWRGSRERAQGMQADGGVQAHFLLHTCKHAMLSFERQHKSDGLLVI